MNWKITLLLTATAFLGTHARAQELPTRAMARTVENAERIRYEKDGTTPAFIVFNRSDTIPGTAIVQLRYALFGNRPEDTWRHIRTENDRIGMQHARYQQQYKQLDVEGQVYIFHGQEGRIVSANGHFVPGITLSVEPSITYDQVPKLAAAGMKDPIPFEHVTNTDVQLVVLPFDGRTVLAYKCTIFSRQPLINRLVYVDAQNGTVVHEVSLLCKTDVPGTAHTHFSGEQPIVADQSGNGFLLRESGRGDGIETYDSHDFGLYTDTDNNWNNVNAAMDQFAGDVHFGAEATYDFFHDHFGRDSYDNNGGVIRSYVNDTSVGVNAYWSGGNDNTMHYGNGNASYFPVASLEIAGHELSHGVTEYSAGLIYEGESGALNESFSDIFGNTLRFLRAPAVATWYCGDQLLRPGASGDAAFRNMSDPNEFLNPDTYGGLFFNSGDIVHYDSGIQNFWYYLLVEGGSGTNDLGNTYSVNGIGFDDAMQIAYRNLVYYLTPTSTFLDARYGAEQAAVDLFGPCSEEHQQTINAWYAVGVGTNGAFIQPEALYTSTGNFACTAPLTTQFTGEGNYASYSWDFGDGTTSQVQNPEHTYISEGSYTITLIVSNNNFCQSPDTLIVPNGIVIDQIDPAAGFTVENEALFNVLTVFADASLYGPTAWEWDFGDGGVSALQHPQHVFAEAGSYEVRLIVHNCHGVDTVVQPVEVNDYFKVCETTVTDRMQGLVFDPGGPNGLYAGNQSCGIVIRPCNASWILLTLEDLDLENGVDFLYVYDGTDATGQLLAVYTGTGARPPLGSVSGAVYLHFISDAVTNLDGFKMRYEAQLGQMPGSWSADFLVNPSPGIAGETLFFQDMSQYYPTGWTWSFGDGTTSTEQHPTHLYTQPGSYEVTLTSFYCDGFSDDVTRTVEITTVGIEEFAEHHLLSVYPNPSNGVFTLQAGVPIGAVVVRLFDMSGREVYHSEMGDVSAEGLAIDPGVLQSGHYLLEVAYAFNGTGTVERHRIQVQR
jgi:Zn-dependent metalloprotease/PKD repeat protein